MAREIKHSMKTALPCRSQAEGQTLPARARPDAQTGYPDKAGSVRPRSGQTGQGWPPHAPQLCESFFRDRGAFTTREFQAYLAENDRRLARRPARILRAYAAQGRVQRLKRGLYVPSGENDPAPALQYVASRMTPDAVLAYHTALQCYGGAYSVWFHAIYAARRPVRPLRVSSGLIRGTAFPQALTATGQEEMETTYTYCGHLRVTTVERTLVDIIDRPRLCGGWDEIMHGYDQAAIVYAHIETGKTIDAQRMVTYALALRNPCTCARLGFILDFYQDEWGLDPAITAPLQDNLPSGVCHLERRRRNYDTKIHYHSKWNLTVPDWIVEREWRRY